MDKNEFSYEGKISKDYKKKQILKTNIVLIPICIFTLFLLWLILIYYDVETDSIRPPNKVSKESMILFFSMTVYIVIIPYISINFFYALYLMVYIRRFSFQISEENIIINHGVFTRTRATIPYSRIQNINIVNGVFDRIFKTFTVKIETAGSSAAAASAQSGIIRPEGYIPGLKNPHIIEQKIKEMLTKYSAIPSGLEEKIFKPEEFAFDNFISYILSKMREGEKLETSIRIRREKMNISAAQLAEKVEVPIQTINYLEEGRYNPSLALAYKIAEVLNCKIEDLFKLI
ncbi:MAG: PH domain-containing protein [Promethearchaeota archaeon]